jgi:hypothetical protein
MDVDIAGRVANIKLPHAHALSPVFEAVVNSIDALAEAGRKNGKINIYIERDHSQAGLPAEVVGPVLPVKTFLVEDNGIGFTDANFKAFNTSDTRKKAAQGGKGVGRLLWLKAFDHAEVASVFSNEDGKKYRRAFDFRSTLRGIENASVTEAPDDAIQTKISLCDYRPEYRDEVPRLSETIARRIVEHCLQYFVLGIAPKISVHDADHGVVHDLDQIYAEEVSPNKTSVDFSAGACTLTIHNLRVNPKVQPRHRLHFCAGNRAVVSENLSGKIPNLFGPLQDEAGQFMYAGYVSGEYLDTSVNSERTAFAIPAEDSMLEPGWETLVQKTTEQARSFIAPFTDSVKDTKEQQIKAFVQSKGVQYRPVVKHRKDLIDHIPPGLTDEKLDLELYRANQIYDADLRAQSTQILTSLEKGQQDLPAFKEQYGKFLEEWNEAGVAKLARHIVHRKATLDFLKASLRMTDSGKYLLEDAIHQIIFPLRKTSDDVRPDQMNLWILDEKLAYHYYLASDIPFEQQDVQVPSKKRPDLIIFNGPSAFVSETPPFSSVVIIEFKRPARNTFTDEENPISQVYQYVELVRSGKATDRGGRPIQIRPDTPFYAYVLCDPTPSLKTQARFAGLMPTADGLGYFGYNDQVGVWLEVTTFDKLVNDAERRNAALFEQLNMPYR